MFIATNDKRPRCAEATHLQQSRNNHSHAQAGEPERVQRPQSMMVNSSRGAHVQIEMRETHKILIVAEKLLVPHWHRIATADSDWGEHLPARRNRTVDTSLSQSNNAPMSKPEIVRRIKSYSADNGYVYQYQFQDVHPAQRDGAKGNEFIYYVSADRKTMFPIRIFVPREALDQSTKQTGRALTGTEEYAVAKMRLFQALDEIPDGRNPGLRHNPPRTHRGRGKPAIAARTPGFVVPHA
jgi:hypothetical protein